MEVLATPAVVRPSVKQIFVWLNEVADPEIPVISVIDLGIVRDVFWRDDELVVAITPTYSGCPAMAVIAQDIHTALAGHGIRRLHLETRLSPAWTTDWLSATGKAKLRDYGIAPPVQQVIDISGISRKSGAERVVNCPHCGSAHTHLISRFGSTPCKALYKCAECREPFDYFKPH